MKKILNTIFLATFLFAAACSDGYDDTRIKKDLDDVGQILDELLTKWEEMGYTFVKLEALVQ